MKKGLMFLLVMLVAVMMTACGTEDEEPIVVEETFYNDGMSLETVQMLQDLKASGVPFINANDNNSYEEEEETKEVEMQYFPKEWPVNEWTKLLPSVPAYDKLASVSSLDNRCVVTVNISVENAKAYATVFKSILAEVSSETDAYLWDSGIYVCSGTDVSGNALSVTCADGTMIIDIILNTNENNSADAE